jgi:hypothetical protein
VPKIEPTTPTPLSGSPAAARRTETSATLSLPLTVSTGVCMKSTGSATV